MDSTVSDSTAPVTFEVLEGRHGRIGRATLNAPKSLNALSLEMIDLLQEQLSAWQGDATIQAVWLDANSDKAFCAGGDIVRLYESMVATPQGERNRHAEAFFGREYQLDHRLHTFGKPLICWGNGIIMGGGLGLLAGASHKVLTETARIAMPEITIGLFPDVGGSYFLSRMPGKVGLFLGLTGANINVSDGLAIGLGDVAIAHESKAAVMSALNELNWDNDAQRHDSQVSDVLAGFGLAADALPQSPVTEHRGEIDRLCQGDDLATVVQAITTLDSDDRWLSKAAATLARGCPQTAALVWENWHRGADMTLADVFRMEWRVAVQCALHGDFQEGVRALLIDKDGQPRFKHRSVADITPAYLAEFYQLPGVPDPLADL
ncbi:Enoyl-CoA hydratase/isomerase family protein [Alloalcanivorax dieselolei B5]|uniref:3-hydroxyisobutyryl-CoA hydrolase n=1 Tax=Alcanivorax dieselolei (strain DSM 16502 / CGMCC 1.3690 / MCCC 1A00001 / B-5) TaxID=930169 RepID=K0CLA1_ALCDB|nr:enoyl-CoA hydratase/isomerase family protein [Alloalcanivorax dieselolei]AFT72562.1 Enoyl-CoA hydratase/isomerase family protein [Alloalcanivorax dieselolei B5]GGJ78785.1 enoyl-CoA hydratase [Alloalcanivorax dieselolei]